MYLCKGTFVNGHRVRFVLPLMDFIYSTTQVLITPRSEGPVVNDTLNMDRVTFVLPYEDEWWIRASMVVGRYHQHRRIIISTD